jgi:hypothetical protein
MIIGSGIQNPNRFSRPNMKSSRSTCSNGGSGSYRCIMSLNNKRAKLILKLANLSLKPTEVRKGCRVPSSLGNGCSAGKTEVRRAILMNSLPQLKMKFEASCFKVPNYTTMMTNRPPARGTRTRVKQKPSARQ